MLELGKQPCQSGMRWDKVFPSGGRPLSWKMLLAHFTMVTFNLLQARTTRRSWLALPYKTKCGDPFKPAAIPRSFLLSSQFESFSNSSKLALRYSYWFVASLASAPGKQILAVTFQMQLDNSSLQIDGLLYETGSLSLRKLFFFLQFLQFFSCCKNKSNDFNIFMSGKLEVHLRYDLLSSSPSGAYILYILMLYDFLISLCFVNFSVLSFYSSSCH